MATGPVGLALPAVRLSGGYFSDLDPVDTALGDLIMAIICPTGGRFMRRSFGSGVASLLFMPADSVFVAALRSAIVDAANKWVPTVSISDVVIKTDGTGVTLTIVYTVTPDKATPQQRQIMLPRQQALKFLSSGTR